MELRDIIIVRENEKMDDYISRQAAIDRFQNLAYDDWNQGASTTWANAYAECAEMVRDLPSADVQPVQRYTEEELRVFRHGISLSLLSKRSSQHWQYDEDTATEIKFLERLYEKVGADMRGEQDG